MRVCVLGAGGLGSLVGARLAESGADVTLIGRPAHVEAIRRNGLRIDGIRGHSVVHDRLRAVADPADAEGFFDYLLLTVKTSDTAGALAGADALRTNAGAALSLQNSVTKDTRLAQWIGADRVVGASTTESATLVEPGRVRHTGTAPVAFYFGEFDGALSARVERLAAAFRDAGFGSAATEFITAVEWEKLLQAALMATFSITAVGFLPDRTITEALQTRPGAEHYVQLATELLTVYRALGFTPRDYFAPYAQFCALAEDDFGRSVERAMALGRAMAERGVRGRPSMHDDLLRHRRTEVGESVGEFVSAAARLGIAAPTLAAAHRIIRCYELMVTEEVPVDVHC
ncbi:MAG: 2-dehydropantoate 2-reductase [Mycobacterium sp.]|nr:2-dehydropantoate 2-reductase [Mycobacterium sp.]